MAIGLFLSCLTRHCYLHILCFYILPSLVWKCCWWFFVCQSFFHWLQQLETALWLFRKQKTGGSDEGNWYVAYIAIYILFSISQLCLCYCWCAKIKKNRGSRQNSSQKIPRSLIRTKLRILAEPRYNLDKISFQGSGQKSHFRDQGSIGIVGGPVWPD